MSSQQVQVLLVSGNKATEKAVDRAISPIAGATLAHTVHDLSHMVSHLEKFEVPIVLVDISTKPAEMLIELEQLISDYGQTRFIVLNDSLRNDLILEAMAIGVRYFLLQESVGANLPRILQKLISETGVPYKEENDGGIVATVLSSGGGSGATTLAVNLANELQVALQEPSLLIWTAPTGASLLTSESPAATAWRTYWITITRLTPRLFAPVPCPIRTTSTSCSALPASTSPTPRNCGSARCPRRCLHAGRRMLRRS